MITAAKVAAVFHMDPVVVLASMPEWIPAAASPSYLMAIRIAAHNVVVDRGQPPLEGRD